MTKVVVGIHGLANKSPKQILARWWQDSLLEGLKHCGIGDPLLDFQMVYWADLLYKNLMHQDALFSYDGGYNWQPYHPAKPGALKVYKDGWRDQVAAEALDFGGDILDILKQQFGVNRLADWVLGRIMKDLEFYYDETREIGNRNHQYEQASTVLKNELKVMLDTQKDKEIMLIAHSMGSIIAYDVLRELEGSDIHVAHLVTIGSPLGLPHVKAKIIQQYGNIVRTPTTVTQSWKNFADPKDPVALDRHLRDDYVGVDGGDRLRVVDDLVQNDYVWVDAAGETKENHHKSYGYLRTPELTTHVKNFLEGPPLNFVVE